MVEGNGVECLKCGAKNREIARFCDNCGANMSGELAESVQLERPRLYSLMKLDWLLRFISMAILGSALLIVSLLWDMLGFALLFLCIGGIGWAFTLYMLSHR